MFVVACLLAAALVVGCQDGRSQLSGAAQAQRYARVSPKEMNTSLTDAELERMYVSLGDVPWAQFVGQADPNLVDVRNLLLDLEQSSGKGGAPSRIGAGGRTPPTVARDRVGSPESEDVAGDIGERRSVAEGVGLDYNVELDPNSCAVSHKTYLRGRWLLASERVTEALDQLSAGVKADPNSARLWRLLGEAYYRADREVAGRQACRRAISLDSESMEAYQFLGLSAQKAGEHPLAAAYFRRALACQRARSDNPITAFLHLQLAGVLNEMGYLDAAATEYRNCYQQLRSQQQYSQSNKVVQQLVRQVHVPLLAMAGLYVQMGWLDKAVEAAYETERVLPAEAEVMRRFVLSLATQHVALGVRYRQVLALSRYLVASGRDSNRAIRLFHEACSEMSKHAAYLETLGRWRGNDGGEVLITSRQYAYGMGLAGRLDEAAAMYERLVAAGRDDETIQWEMADIYGSLGQWDKMVSAYGAQVQHNPEDVARVAAAVREQAARMGNDMDEHLGDWLTYPVSDQNYGTVYVAGVLVEAVGRLELAERYYERVLAQRPGFLEARIRLIELLLDRRQFSDVLAWVEQSDMSDMRAELLWFAGRACVGLDQLDQATVYYQRLIEHQPDDVQGYLALAEVLRRQGEFARAETILLRVLARWPGNEPAFRQSVVLYCQWAGQEDMVEQMALEAERRGRGTLQRWLNQWREKHDEVGNQQFLTGFLEENVAFVGVLAELQSRHPSCRAIAMTLSDLYLVCGEEEKALLVVERALAMQPDDRRLLVRAALLSDQQGQLSPAAAYRKRLWELDGHDPAVLLVCLNTMRRSGQATQAVQLLRAAVETGIIRDATGATRLQAEAARLFVVTRQFDVAVELFERWHADVRAAQHEADRDNSQQPDSEEPDSADAAMILLNRLIWALAASGDHDRSLELTRELYSSHEQADAGVALMVARALNIRRRHQLSHSLLTELLSQRPENVMLRRELYLTMIQQGASSEACNAATRWLGERPSASERLWLAVLVLRESGDFVGAADLIEQRLDEQDSPESELEELFVETLLLGGLHDRAQEALTAGLLGGKLSGQWIDYKIRLDAARGDCDAAMSRLDDAVGNRSDVQVALARVDLLDRCGRTSEALEQQGAIVEEHPEDGQARLRYSTLLDRVGRRGDALEQLETLLAQNPDDPLVMNNLGYSLVQAGLQPERARELLKKSLRLMPDSAPTTDSLGWCYYRRGQFGRALEYLYSAGAGLAGNDAEILDHIGDTLYRLGRGEESCWYWARSVVQLKKRLPLELYVTHDIERIEAKLAQWTSGAEVTVAGLFDGVRVPPPVRRAQASPTVIPDEPDNPGKTDRSEAGQEDVDADDGHQHEPDLRDVDIEEVDPEGTGRKDDSHRPPGQERNDDGD